mmetsp:Transcript_952/g.2095  ORF Transcript_952/g.2095 Transcript_952/m.2095 type:complete len:245 (+) Transcript_952:433-1167(+)
MSGFDTSSRHSATLRRCPPDRCVGITSAGGQLSEDIAVCTSLSSCQQSIRSICAIASSCSRSSSCSSASLSASWSLSLLVTSSSRCNAARCSLTPSRMLSITERSSSSWGSCCSIPMLMPGLRQIVPSYSVSTSAISLSSVLLPLPFAPSTPILAPGTKLALTLSRITRPPGIALRTWCIVRMLGTFLLAIFIPFAPLAFLASPRAALGARRLTCARRSESSMPLRGRRRGGDGEAMQERWAVD